MKQFKQIGNLSSSPYPPLSSPPLSIPLAQNKNSLEIHFSILLF